MCCSVFSRAKKSLLPSVSDVTYGERGFGTQALWVCVCDALGPPGFQRSPGISSSEVLWAPDSADFISSIYGTFSERC